MWKTKLIGNRNSISTYQEPSYANNNTHTNKQIPWIWFNKCLKIPKLCSFTFLNLWEERSGHLLQDLHLFPENIKIGQRARPLGDMEGWTVTGDGSLQPETAQTTFAKKFSTNDNNRKMHLVLRETLLRLLVQPSPMFTVCLPTSAHATFCQLPLVTIGWTATTWLNKREEKEVKDPPTLRQKILKITNFLVVFQNGLIAE